MHSRKAHPRSVGVVPKGRHAAYAKMGKKPEQKESVDEALTFGERFFYVIASVVMFALSGLIAPSRIEMRTFSGTEQWELWQAAAIVFAAAFIVGLHGLSPPYKNEK